MLHLMLLLILCIPQVHEHFSTAVHCQRHPDTSLAKAFNKAHMHKYFVWSNKVLLQHQFFSSLTIFSIE